MRRSLFSTTARGVSVVMTLGLIAAACSTTSSPERLQPQPSVAVVAPTSGPTNSSIAPSATTLSDSTVATTPAIDNTDTPVATIDAVPSGEFRVEPAQDDLLAIESQLDRLASEGFAFVGPLATSQTATDARFGDLFVRDAQRANLRLDYVLDERPAEASQWLEIANARGAEGYLYKGPYIVQLEQAELFMSDTASATRYTYEVVPNEFSATTETLIAQLNAQGARGFRWSGPQIFGADPVHVFASDGSATTYSYEATTAVPPLGADTIDDLLITLNEQGRRGAQFVTSYTTSGFTETVLVFESTSATASVPLVYEAAPTEASDSFDGLVQTVNERAATRAFFWGEIAMNDFSTHWLFVTGASNLRHPLTGPWYP
jgi:hypothetical protein